MKVKTTALYSRSLIIIQLFLATAGVSAQTSQRVGGQRGPTNDDNISYREETFQYQGGKFCTAANDWWINEELPLLHCKVDQTFRENARGKDVTFYESLLTGECGPNCRPSCLTLMLDLDKLDYTRELICEEEELCHCEFTKGGAAADECLSETTTDLFDAFPKCYLEDADCLGATVYDDTVTYVEQIFKNNNYNSGITLPDLDHCTKIPNDKMYNRFKDWKVIQPQTVDCEGDCFNERKLYFEYCNVVEEDPQCDGCENQQCGSGCENIVEPFPPGWTTFVVSASIPYEATGTNSKCDDVLQYEEETSSACFLQRVEIYYPLEDEDCSMGCPHCHSCPLLSLGDKFGPLEVVGFGHNFDRRHGDNYCTPCDKRERIEHRSENQLSCDDLLSCNDVVDCYTGESLGIPNFSDNMCSFGNTTGYPTDSFHTSDIVYPSLSSLANNTDTYRPIDQAPDRPLGPFPSEDQAPNQTSTSYRAVMPKLAMASNNNHTMVSSTPLILANSVGEFPPNVTNASAGQKQIILSNESLMFDQNIISNETFIPVFDDLTVTLMGLNDQLNQTLVSDQTVMMNQALISHAQLETKDQPILSNETSSLSQTLDLNLSIGAINNILQDENDKSPETVVSNLAFGSNQPQNLAVNEAMVLNNDSIVSNQTLLSDQTSSAFLVYNKPTMKSEGEELNHSNLDTNKNMVSNRTVAPNEMSILSNQTILDQAFVSNNSISSNPTLSSNKISVSNQSLGAMLVSFERTNATQSENEQFKDDMIYQVVEDEILREISFRTNETTVANQNSHSFFVPTRGDNISNGNTEQSPIQNEIAEVETFDHDINSSTNISETKSAQITGNMPDLVAEDNALVAMVSNHSFGTFDFHHKAANTSNGIGDLPLSNILQAAEGEIFEASHVYQGMENDILESSSGLESSQTLGSYRTIAGGSFSPNYEINTTLLNSDNEGEQPDERYWAIENIDKTLQEINWGPFPVSLWIAFISGVFFTIGMCILVVGINRRRNQQLLEILASLQESKYDDDEEITIEFTDQEPDYIEFLNQEPYISNMNKLQEVFSPSGRTIGIDFKPGNMENSLSTMSRTPRILSKPSYISNLLTQPTFANGDETNLPTSTAIILSKHSGDSVEHAQTTVASTTENDEIELSNSNDCEVPQACSPACRTTGRKSAATNISISGDCEVAQVFSPSGRQTGIDLTPRIDSKIFTSDCEVGRTFSPPGTTKSVGSSPGVKRKRVVTQPTDYDSSPSGRTRHKILSTIDRASTNLSISSDCAYAQTFSPSGRTSSIGATPRITRRRVIPKPGSIFSIPSDCDVVFSPSGRATCVDDTPRITQGLTNSTSRDDGTNFSIEGRTTPGRDDGTNYSQNSEAAHRTPSNLAANREVPPIKGDIIRLVATNKIINDDETTFNFSDCAISSDGEFAEV